MVKTIFGNHADKNAGIAPVSPNDIERALIR